MTRAWPDIATPPGETLADELKARRMTARDLATKMDLPLPLVRAILAGRAAITAATARQLQKALGVDAAFWRRLERNYRLTKARLPVNRAEFEVLVRRVEKLEQALRRT